MAELPDATGTPSPLQRIRRWLGPLAILAALGLGIAALVVALTRSPAAPSGKSAAATATAASCPTTTVARDWLPSVVTVQVAGAQASGTGSGEVIDRDGHILTNNHVIAAAAGGGTIAVLFADGSTQKATLVGRDPQTDLAVLKIADPAGRTPIGFGSSGGLRVGQPVIALGAPLGLSSTVTAGIVSALDRSVDLPADNGGRAILVAAVQTDAAINPGNSGGALVDCAGRLVGIPTAGATVPGENGASSAGNIGIGFAIPSDFARSIADELISTGRVSHGFLGLTVDTTPDGLFLTSVTAGGPSEQAGLRAGDLITEIDGTPATSGEQLLALTVTKSPGDKVTLKYRRAAASNQATVTLGSR